MELFILVHDNIQDIPKYDKDYLFFINANLDYKMMLFLMYKIFYTII